MDLSVHRKILLIGAGFLILMSFLILMIGMRIGARGNAQHTSIQPKSSSGEKSSDLSLAFDKENAPSDVSGVSFKVTRVIDGDTIEIEGGERVRYIGIDTPETVDPRKPVQCFGVESSKKNKELVEGKMVRLEKDITDRDKYRRLLRYVWVGDTFVNLALVKEGYAYSYSYPPDIAHQDQFIAAEREARETKMGLWNACPAGNNSTPSTPSVPIDNTSETAGSSSCLIKGNVSASGEKIYHLPGCGSYAKTRIDESHGERWFCSEGEAQTAGWRRALNCL